MIFTRDEEAQLPEVIARAADALEVVLREGFTAAMNRYNAPEGKRAQPDDGRPPASEQVQNEGEGR